MRIVVSDTGPLNYLLLIEQIDLLGQLFQQVHIPAAVRTELAGAGAPQVVRDWIAKPPAWLVVEPAPAVAPTPLRRGAGEEAVIALANELKAELLLIDDREGVAAARAQGCTVTGTLGILSLAAMTGLVALPEALARLTATNFHVRPQLIDALLSKYKSDA